MTDTSKKRSLDAFFKPISKKPKVQDDNELKEGELEEVEEEVSESRMWQLCSVY